jgi:SAM-dependent methyltransferase
MSAATDILCPICGASPTGIRHLLASAYLTRRVAYTVRGCPECGHHFACGPTDPATLALVYGPEFHANSQQQGPAAASPIKVNARRRAQRLADLGNHGRLLDIGAGHGYFVEAAAGHFAATGIEYSATAAAAARAGGLAVVTGRFPAEAPPGPYDIITLWDVLAGLPDPLDSLRAVHAALAPGGQVVFTVPLVSSFTARLLGRFWPLWIPPVNLHYFTRASLRQLLAAANLEELALETEAKQVALNFLVRKACRATGLVSLGDRVGALAPAWPVNLNLGDILTVSARRPGGAAS